LKRVDYSSIQKASCLINSLFQELLFTVIPRESYDSFAAIEGDWYEFHLI